MALRADETLVTPDKASARFKGTKGTALEVYKNSSLTFRYGESGLRLRLTRGAFDATVLPRPESPHVVVVTANASAHILGTEFRVIAKPESTALAVRRGKVKLVRRSDGESLVVTKERYAAVAAKWPFRKLDATVCPVWRDACIRATGKPYP